MRIEQPWSMVALGFSVLLFTLSCGGDDGEVNSPEPPPPDVVGLWIGTETVSMSGAPWCSNAIETGARTGDIFDVTQTGDRIVIVQLVNCQTCRFDGRISGDGSFEATGRANWGGGGVVLTVAGQVNGNTMTARKSVDGVDCVLVARYDLTRP